MNIADLDRTLPTMGDAERIRTVRALTKRDMVRLWESSAGREVTAEDFVPAHVPAGVEVIHWGKNSLPAFYNFQKRFTRGVVDGVVYGYNWNGLPTWTTLGPGYFIGHYDAAQQAFGLDYYDVPPATAVLPRGWPERVPNERGLQQFIYAKMVDYMRKVADGVTIGRAWRYGKITSNYFVLARSGI